MLVVLDEHTHESLALEVSRHIKCRAVIAMLDELTAIRGALKNIRSDNGPEFIAHALQRWCSEGGTNALHIEPGAPWQNEIVESFNGRLRDELPAVERDFRVTRSKQSISAIAGDWITTIDARSVRLAIKRLRNLQAMVVKERCRAVNRWQSRKGIDACTDETRIQRPHQKPPTGWC